MSQVSDKPCEQAQLSQDQRLRTEFAQLAKHRVFAGSEWAVKCLYRTAERSGIDRPAAGCSVACSLAAVAIVITSQAHCIATTD